jgi:hypothetical protein
LAYAAYIAIGWASQLPLDVHAFRQTQTALTSLWFVKEGFQLAYQTPVGGAPWSIPFEFPLYQYLVALLSQATPLTLATCGRLVSFTFLALCLVPARTIVRQLGLSGSVWLVFAAILLSSPIYLYWGRTFMIETTAVFFAIAAIRYFIDILQGRSQAFAVVLFLLCMTLAVLQKATTGLPVLAVLGICYFFSSLAGLKNCTAQRGTFAGKRIALAALYIGLPVVVCLIWTMYTDHVKALNPLGARLTSAELSVWNWGTLGQKLSPQLFVDVLWERIFKQNLGGDVGLAVLVFAAFSSAQRQVKLVVLTAVAMGLLPLFLFTNLHIVHNYYQTANVVFLIFAVSVGLGHIAVQSFGRTDLVLALLLLVIGSNYYWFGKEYRGVVYAEFKKEHSRDIAIGAILKHEMPEGKAFVAYGNDWSSSIAYLAERKSFTVPAFMENYEQRAANPENYMAVSELGAVVLCQNAGHPTLNQLFRWAGTRGQWRFGETQGCYIVLPEQTLAAATAAPAAHCEGAIDVASLVPGSSILNVAGWTSMTSKYDVVPEKTYVTLRKDGEPARYFQSLQVARPDVISPSIADPGFSRLIDTSKLDGIYTVGLARVHKGQLEQCQFQLPVTIPKDLNVAK